MGTIREGGLNLNLDGGAGLRWPIAVACARSLYWTSVMRLMTN